MTEQLKEIGCRLFALRDVAEMTAEVFCEKTGISTQELSAYEKGELDFSFSFLYNAARVLGVDVVDLMSGESPHLSQWCIVRNGEGYDVDRRAAYKYSHLAFTFQKKIAEPFLVTVETSEDVPKKHTHDGQEFVWMVSGCMKFYIENAEYTLEPGDSVYFNAAKPHAMQALDNDTAQFLAVVMGQ